MARRSSRSRSISYTHHNGYPASRAATAADAQGAGKDARSRARWAVGLALPVAALVIALFGATAHAQISSAPVAANPPVRDPAGAGRGGDPKQQAIIAANQQADAAFQRADRNGDGKLSRAEADHLPAVAARFEQVDSNRDTFISRGEFNRVLN